MLDARAVVVPRVRAVPTWAWVAGIVVCSAVFRYALTGRVVAPWIMVDELIYSELAKSFAESGRFLVRGHANFGVGLVYPALIAPAWRLFGAVPDAYAAAKAINAVLMSLAAVPAYLLARRVASQPLALLAAVLTVAVPSLVYTGTLMTENAFYPLFLTCVWLLVRALEQPSAGRQVAVLAVAALAFLTRAQAVVLMPAIALSPALYVRYRRQPWRALLAWRWLYALLALGVVAALVYQAERGSVLGAYQGTTSGNYTLGGSLRWLLYHLGELSLYVAVAPLAAFALLAWLAPRLPREVQVFMAAAVPVTVLLVVEVAVFASVQVQRIEERNMFYVAPLLLIALLAWIEVGLPRPRAASVAAIAAAALVGVVPFAGLINGNAAADTLAFLPFWSVQDLGVVSLDGVAPVAVAAAIVLGAAFLLVPRRWVLALPAAILVWFALALTAIETNAHGGIHELSLQALFGGTTKLAHPDWIDRQVGRNADVAFVWTGNDERKFSLWTNEFFNRSIGPVYDLGAAAPGGLPSTPVWLDPQTGLLQGAAPAAYAVTDTSVPLDAQAIGSDPKRGLVLYRLDGPLRVSYTTSGVDADGWSGRRFGVRTFGCLPNAHVRVHVAQDPNLFPGPQTVLSAGRSFRVHGERDITVPLGGGCRASFSVQPARSPGPQDPRVLGIRVSNVTPRP